MYLKVKNVKKLKNGKISISTLVSNSYHWQGNDYIGKWVRDYGGNYTFTIEELKKGALEDNGIMFYNTPKTYQKYLNLLGE